MDREGEEITLKLLVDTDKKKVVLAESDHDFVDLLFGFLTLPIGLIVSNASHFSSRLGIGCMNNLYKSIKKLDVEWFQTPACKTMLLHPRSAYQDQYRDLKFLNTSCSDSNKYYKCSSSSFCIYSPLMSSVKSTLCRCKKPMNHEVAWLQKSSAGNCPPRSSGVFVDTKASYVVTDGLQVMVMPSNCLTMGFSLLDKLGFSAKHGSALEVKNVLVGKQEVLHLLSSSLLCKTPLSDVFLAEQQQDDATVETEASQTKRVRESTSTTASSQKSVELLLGSFNNLVLYALAKDDFVDLIFGFLTFPLGAIIKVLHGQSCMGSVDNLFNSVEDLSINGRIVSEEIKAMLLDPELAPYYGSENQVLPIKEACVPKYYSMRCRCHTCKNYECCLCGEEDKDFRFGCSHGIRREDVSVVNPKLRIGSVESGGRFMDGGRMFLVTDDLTVRPVSFLSALSILAELNVPIGQVQERMVCVGQQEALTLLKASLTSKTVLNDVFNQ